MRANKRMVIDGKNLVVESRLVGEPSSEALDAAARIIAHAYIHREVTDV